MKSAVQGAHRPMARLTIIFSFLLTLSMVNAVSLARSNENPPAIFVFGDSLSDVGNNNDMPDFFRANFPHYGVDFPGGVATGRFTNGYNFIDIIAQHVGFIQSPPAYASVATIDDISTGVNFASGGSGILVECVEGTTKKCITMKEQLYNFKSIWETLRLTLGRETTKELISKSIFVFTCGGNDLNNFFSDNFLNLFPPIDAYVANLTSTLRDQIKELYDLGGRKFFIINVPAIGLIPPSRVLEFLNVPNRLNDFAQKFNKAEYRMLEKLSSTLPGMKYSVGNAYNAIVDVIQRPKEFGFKNVTSPCCGEVSFAIGVPPVKIISCAPDAWLCSNHSEFVFWDHIHPTLPVIKYSGELYYSGGPNYASPINLKQLVGSHSTTTGRVFARSLGRGFEAM